MVGKRVKRSTTRASITGNSTEARTSPSFPTAARTSGSRNFPGWKS